MKRREKVPSVGGSTFKTAYFDIRCISVGIVKPTVGYGQTNTVDTVCAQYSFCTHLLIKYWLIKTRTIIVHRSKDFIFRVCLGN